MSHDHDHQHDHDHSPVAERHCDVAVIGGSAAGLAAALQLARQRRSVIVVDAGEPRNAPAAHMHSFLGREGEPPGELTRAGRAEVRSYGGEILEGRAERVTRTDDGRMRVELEGGNAVVARRVLAATGLVDWLPDIEGLTEHWGRDVIHCPFCHGYEVRDRRIVQIVLHPMGLHASGLFRQLTAQLTIVLHNPAGVDPAQVDALKAAGVEVVHEQVRRVVAGDDGRVAGIELTDGGYLAADAIAIAPRWKVRAEPFIGLGLQPVDHPNEMGDFVETDPAGATSVPGLYAAGNIADPTAQVLPAAANGSRVGAMIAFDLAALDVDDAARPSGNESDWDHRYGGDQLWSGNPNGTLVDQARGLTPGRALDVGAGEGGDAIWLAEQGWQVTASDISGRALDRVAAEAARRKLDVECVRADANSLEPFAAGGFDLVSAQYASLPRTPDDRGIHNVLAAVAPGGTLVVVSHDLTAMRDAMEASGRAGLFDPDAYVRVEDFVAVIADSPGWTIDLHATVPRPPGAVSTHHVDDIVLRARRAG